MIKKQSQVRKLTKTLENAKKSNFQIGDTVLVKKDFRENKLSAKFNENPHVVTDKKGSMITVSSNNHDITRNSTGFKKIKQSESTEIQMEEEDDKPIINADDTTSNSSVTKDLTILHHQHQSTVQSEPGRNLYVLRIMSDIRLSKAL